MKIPIVSKTANGKKRPQAAFIPPLETGDHLSRAEFERRYEAMPEVKKAELIEGVVYMPSPVRFKKHSKPHQALNTCLGIYQTFTPGVFSADNSTVRLDLKNDVQPDGILFIDPDLGGQVKFEDDYIVGAPELGAEIASSSVSIDLGAKKRAYRRNGVLEYVVWRVLDEKLDWFVLRGEQYQPLPKRKGVFRSEVFPGFWIDAQALLRYELRQVYNILHEGLASPEHQAFVDKLSKAKTDSGRATS